MEKIITETNETPDESQGMLDIQKNAKSYVDIIIKDLHSLYGFDLSNIEIVGLRNIALNVEKDKQLILNRGGSSHSDFDPIAETLNRFFLEFYGIYFEDSLKIIRDKNGNIDFNGFGEYLKRRQEEQHMP
jgi:hypothetical protein